jgi:SAM-dependent methyltransferase
MCPLESNGLFPATSMPDRDWWQALWPDPLAVLDRMDIRPGMNVLDLCCGDGYFTAPLARLVQGRVDALDLDPAMIERAKAEVARHGATVRSWICADALAIGGLLPEPVDYVLIANTFHGVPNQSALARTVKAVLKENGLFGIVNWRPFPREQTTVLGKPRGPATPMRMSPAALIEVVAPEGFKVARTINLPPYHYGMVFEATR